MKLTRYWSIFRLHFHHLATTYISSVFYTLSQGLNFLNVAPDAMEQFIERWFSISLSIENPIRVYHSIGMRLGHFIAMQTSQRDFWTWIINLNIASTEYMYYNRYSKTRKSDSIKLKSFTQCGILERMRKEKWKVDQ